MTAARIDEHSRAEATVCFHAHGVVVRDYIVRTTVTIVTKETMAQVLLTTLRDRNDRKDGCCVTVATIATDGDATAEESISVEDNG